MIRYLMLLTSTLLVSCAITTDDCDTLHYVNQGIYYGKNFSIKVPSAHCKIVNHGREGFSSVDFLLGSRKEADRKIYSIEISKVSRIRSNQEFKQYWEDFLPQYLSKNFGEYGHYNIIFSESNPSSLGNDTFFFVGTGNHNTKDLQPGSIIGISRNLGKKVVTLYVLINRKLNHSLPEIQASTDFEEFMEYYESFKSSE